MPESSPRRTRRRFFGAAAAAYAVSSTTAVPGIASPYERELSFVGRSGTLGALFDARVVQPFEHHYNCRVTTTRLDSVAALAKVQAERDAPTVDVVWTTDMTRTQGANEGLFARLDLDRIPSARDCYDFARYRDSIGMMWGLSGVIVQYNRDRFREHGIPPPRGFRDLWHRSTAGHIGLYDLTTVQGLDAFLMLNRAAGGSEDDAAPGFSFLRAHRDRIGATVSTPPAMDRLFESGQAWIAANSDARAYLLQAKGLPLEIVYPQEGVPQIGLELNLVTGSRRPLLAHAFIDWVLSPRIQASIASEMLISPVVPGLHLDRAVSNRLIYGTPRVAELFRPRFERVIANFSNMLDRWNREMAP